MVNYREILRLQSLGYSQRQIASSVRSSRDTVSQVCRLATIHGLEWPLPDEMTNHVIQETFFPAQLDCNSRRIPDYAKMHKELAKPGGDADPFVGRVLRNMLRRKRNALPVHTVLR